MRPIQSIPVKHLVTGISGYYEHGREMSFGLIEIKAGSELPAHHHVHEQITYMLEGQLNMKIGDEQCSLIPGMVQVIPSNTVHSAVAITDCKLIDVFSPVREEYKIP